MMKKPAAPRGLKFEEHLEGSWTEFVEIYVMDPPSGLPPTGGQSWSRYVTVYKRVDVHDYMWKLSEINWSASGYQSLHTTLKFIKALHAAVKWAQWLDERHPHPEGTVAK
jgi:hypothetical protein